MILGPLLEAYFLRALRISQGDLTVLFSVDPRQRALGSASLISISHSIRGGMGGAKPRPRRRVLSYTGVLT